MEDGFEEDVDDAGMSGGKEAFKEKSLKNVPRRNLSFQESSTKKGFFRRSSMSDLTDEVSVTPIEDLGEVDINLPYAEIVTIAGVSDIPILCSLNESAEQHDEPPGPSPGLSKRLRSRRAAPPPAPKAVISLVAPHKMLIISKDFCYFFGYTVEEEICGREVKILQGPRTDPTALTSAIKSCATGSTTSRSVVLYGRDGTEVEVEATFAPYFGMEESLAGCLVELKASAPAAQWPAARTN